MNPNTAERKIVIEQHKRFSESCLWRLQREFFDKQSINAWVSAVPFYITSNPFIGKCYAQIFIRFVKDWVQKNPGAKQHPFYILEMGTGTGRFSYYVLKELAILQKSLQLEDISICYVMSDFTKHNVQYYETHPALIPFIEKGMIDFAIYDLETEKPITLLRQNVRLSPEVLVNPLTVFANYIFDTVSHDSFTVHEEKLYELLTNISTEENNIEHGKPIDMEKLTVEHTVKEAKANYYNDPHLDNILALYKTALKDTSFLFPTGSFNALKYLKKLSNDKLLVISTDKGYSTLESLDNLGHPSIAFHGSFSMMVNFHAIAEYFKNCGGDYVLQTPRKGIKTSVFSSGFKLADLPETSVAIQEHVEGFSPGDYFILHRRLSEAYEECDLDVIAAHLELSLWDPHIYQRVSSRINAVVGEADYDTITFMSKNMPRLASNYYTMPKAECILFEIGIFFHAIKNYPEAFKYYEQAKPYVGEQFGLFYNMALCLHHMDHNPESLELFKHAQQLDPESKETQEWITYLEKMISGEPEQSIASEE